MSRGELIIADFWELLARDSVVLAVHASLLPSGKVLYFGGSEHDEDPRSLENTRLWNPKTANVEFVPPSNNDINLQVDLFCCGHCLLPNGDLFAAGGTALYDKDAPKPHQEFHHFIGIQSTLVFNWRNERWHRAASMRKGRWYPTCITLPNGQVLTMSGHSGTGTEHENTSLEIFDADKGQWFPNPDSEQYKPFLTSPPLEDTGFFYLISGPIDGASAGAIAGGVLGAIVSGGLLATVGAEVGAIVGAGLQPKLKGIYPEIYYPRLHVLPNGQIFSSTSLQVSGLRKTMSLNPSTGALTILADPPFNQPRPYSHHGGGRYMENVYTRLAFASVLLPLIPPHYDAKILICGEKQAKIFEVDKPHLGWSNAGNSKSFMRAYVNAVILPDATILILGGADSERIPKEFDPYHSEGGEDKDAIPFAERYHPDSNSWETLSSPKSSPAGRNYKPSSNPYTPIARVYHSVSLLLPDGRVWIAGSNHDSQRNKHGTREDGQGDARELRMEVYSPPYLFAKNANGDDILDDDRKPIPAIRPEITRAPAGCAYNQKFTIYTSNPNQIKTVALIRCSSVTHSFNPDQRYVELVNDYRRTTLTSLTISGPPSAEIAPPGYYLLFILNYSGIPSVAKFFRVSPVYPLIEGFENGADSLTSVYDFGTIEFGNSRVASFQFKNIGVGELKLMSPSIEGDFRDKTIPGSEYLGTEAKLKNIELVLSPDKAGSGNSAVLKMIFAPTDYGVYSGTLTLVTNAPDALIVKISLTAKVVGLKLEITPNPVRIPTLEFGDVPVGSNKILTINVRNVGGSDAFISDMIFSDSGSNQQFYGPELTLPYIIPKLKVRIGEVQTFDIMYMPTLVVDIQAQMTLVVESTPPPATCHRNYSIDLWGRGIGPIVTMQPTRLTFPSQIMNSGSGVAQKVTITNTGLAPLNISNIRTSYEFAYTTACSANLSIGQSCDIDVTFRPANPGYRMGTLTIESNAGGSPHSVTLEGIGVSEPIAILNPTSLDFGNQPVGTSGAAQTITLKNNGSANLNISSIAITGANTGDFIITADSCSSFTVQSEHACIVSVKFTPTTLGNCNAYLMFNDNAGGSPHTVSLNGFGVAPPPRTLNPTTLEFGSEPIGSTSTAQAVTLTNNSSAPLNMTDVSIKGPNAHDFIIKSNACKRNISSGKSCIVTVVFAPTIIGRLSASLTFTDNASNNPYTIPLEGIGIGPDARIDPPSLIFPAQQIGSFSQSQQVQVYNIGNGALNISSIAVSSGFMYSILTSTSITPAGFCLVRVICSPISIGPLSGELTIVSNAIGSPHKVLLRGEGMPQPVTVSPTSLVFGSLSVGSRSAPQIITVTNTGTSAVNITNVGFDGSNPTDFVKVRDSCIGSTIRPNKTCSIEISFSPNVIGRLSAELIISTDHGILIVLLTGGGS